MTKKCYLHFCSLLEIEEKNLSRELIENNICDDIIYNMNCLQERVMLFGDNELEFEMYTPNDMEKWIEKGKKK